MPGSASSAPESRRPGAGPVLHEMVVRDGSYVTDFRLTAAECGRLVAASAAAGLGLVEVGHGVGLGAGKAFPAGASDEQYLEAAAAVRGPAKLSVLTLPKFCDAATLDLIRRFKGHLGMIRLSPDVDDPSPAWPLAEALRDTGVPLSLNLLKTYRRPSSGLGPIFAEARRRGFALTYVVDSAGCMEPGQVAGYVRVARAEGLEVGFHGHDNLRLAAANSLAAMEAGAGWIDASLRGIGRSAGNTQTEALGLVLIRAGKLELDLARLFEAADQAASIYSWTGGVTPLDLLFGAAGVHSSHEQKFMELASARGEGIRDLMIRCFRQGWQTPQEVR